MAQARRKDPDYANSADDPKLRSGISNPALVFDRFNLLRCFTASRMMLRAKQHAYSTYILRSAAGPGTEGIKAYSYYQTDDGDWKVSAGHAKPPNYFA